MFNIGPEEILLILVIALVFLGPKRLPEVARQIGKGMREFKSLTSRAQDELKANLALESLTGDQDDLAPLEPAGSLPDGSDEMDGAAGLVGQPANGEVKKPKAKKKKKRPLPAEEVPAAPVALDGGAVDPVALDGPSADPVALDGASESPPPAAAPTDVPADPGPVTADTDPMERSG